MFHSLKRVRSSSTALCTVVPEIVARLPEHLKNISVERLKILKPAATYGWKESSESRNPSGSTSDWKETWTVHEVLGSGEMPAAQKDRSFLLLQANPTTCRSQRAEERHWEICYPSCDTCSTEKK